MALKKEETVMPGHTKFLYPTLLKHKRTVVLCTLMFWCLTASATGQPRLKIDQDRVLPDQTMTLSVEVDKTPGSRDWVGLIPDEVPHGDAGVNDRYDLQYKYVEKKTSMTFEFKSPLKPGFYTFRYNESSTQKETSSIRFEVWAPPPSITLSKTTFAPDEQIELTFTAWKWFGSGSWIGIIPSEVGHGDVGINDRHDLAYRYLKNATEGSQIYKAPLKPGAYDFRMNQVNPIRREVASVRFDVVAPPPQIVMTTSRVAPSSKIQIRFTAWKWFGSGSWIGIIPSEVAHGDAGINDRHDLAYQYLKSETEGQQTYDIPKNPGRYDFRMNQVGPVRKEVASFGFEVLADGSVIAIGPNGPSLNATAQTAPADRNQTLKGRPDSPPVQTGAPPEKTAASESGQRLAASLEKQEYSPRERIEIHYEVFQKFELDSLKVSLARASEGKQSAQATFDVQLRRDGMHSTVGKYTLAITAPKHMGRYELRITEGKKDQAKIIKVIPITVIDPDKIWAHWAVMDDHEFDPQKFMTDMADPDKGIPEFDIAAWYQDAVPPLNLPPQEATASIPADGHLIPKNWIASVGHDPVLYRSIRQNAGTGGTDAWQVAKAGKLPKDAFDGYRKKLERMNVSFGHDTKFAASMEDLTKQIVSNLGGKADLVGKVMVNSYDFYNSISEDAIRNGKFPYDDFAIYIAKMTFDTMDADELGPLAKKFGVDTGKFKDDLGKVVGSFEKGGEAGGKMAAADLRGALKGAILGGMDIVCPTCGIAKRAIDASIEAVKATRAFIEDSSTQTQFDAWREHGVFNIGAGQRQMMNNARRAMNAKWKAEHPDDEDDEEYTEAEVEAYVLRQFEEWKRIAERNESTSGLLADAENAYVNDLSDSDRRAFGKDPDQQAANFAAVYLKVRQQLLGYAGKHRIDKKSLARMAATLAVVYQNDGAHAYKRAFAHRLQMLGWIRKFKKVDDDLKRHVIERLSNLSQVKAEALAAHLGIRLPESLYKCLCSRVEGYSIGVGISYRPDADDCTGGTKGGVCLWRGMGCGREPLPTSSKAWGSCLVEAKFESGQTLNEYISEQVARTRMKRK